jgi:hypothetical protein
MNTFRRLALVTLGLVLTACGDDSTAPAAVDLAFVATRFDALGRDRADAGDPGGAIAARGAALALRLGARPARVRIAVDGVPEDYLALEIEHAFADEGTGSLAPMPAVNVRTMMAWRGVRPDRFLAIMVAGDTGTFAEVWTLQSSEANSVVYGMLSSGILFERGGPPWIAVAGGARTTRQSVGGECNVPRRSAFMPALGPIACHRAVFLTRFNMTVNETNTINRVLRSRVVEMGAHDVAGVQLRYRPLPTMCPVC